MEDVKIGARNNSGDASRLQAIHDLAVENGAVCKPAPEVVELPILSMQPEDLTYHGAQVKALGGGKVGGYLVRYGNEADTDVEGEYFDASTEFGVSDGGVLPVFYHHGMDDIIKSRRIGKGPVKQDDIGLWLEAQLEMRDEYEKAIYEMAEAGKLGWSSGAAGHLVEREPAGKATYIKTWIIAEASLTPTPAEYRNSAVPIKSLLKQAEVPSQGTPAEAENNTLIQKLKGDTMEITEEKFQEMLNAAASKAVETLASEPATKRAAGVAVVADEADRAATMNPFKSIGQFYQAVASAAISGRVNRVPVGLAGEATSRPAVRSFHAARTWAGVGWKLLSGPTARCRGRPSYTRKMWRLHG